MVNSKTAVVAGVVVIGAVIGLAVALRPKTAKGSTGRFTLSVSPTAGNPLTQFQFSGTMPGVPTGTAVALFDSTGRQWGETAATSDPAGNFTIGVSGFTTGTYVMDASTGTTVSNTVTITVTSGTTSTLTIQPSIATVLNEPDGSTIVELGVSAFGGELPYSFTAAWSDGTVQHSPTGVFSRTFPSGTLPDTSALIECTSADGQHASTTVTAS